MRFLFTVQGEGRGHFTQALSLSSMLRKHGHEVVGVLVGKSKWREIPEFFTEKIEAPIHVFESPNFTTFYKNKRPIIVLSVVSNFMRLVFFRESILFVKNKIEEYKPDVVINFYEFITGMTFGIYSLDKKLGVKLVCVAHQYVLLNPHYNHSRARCKIRIVALILKSVLSAGFESVGFIVSRYAGLRRM